MDREAILRTAAGTDGNEVVGATLARLASLQFEPPEGFADRVALAAGRRRRLARADELKAWARRRGSARRRALASSAFLAGAVALGLEARHLRRSREMKAA
jgi:hypothetical protein